MATVVNIPIERLAAELGRTPEVIEKAFHSEPLKKKISIVTLADYKDRFTKSVSPDGKPWKKPVLRSGLPLLDQGRLRASATAPVTPRGVELHNNAIQARIHNEGGTIHAKRRFLTIPATREAQLAGSPRRMSGLHFEVRKGANQGRIADADGDTIFFLKDAVYIPKREHMGWSQHGLNIIDRTIGDHIEQTLAGG